MPVNGLVVMTPTGTPPVVVTGAGSSYAVGANGSVVLNSCVTASLNNVFTSNYDNYMIVLRYNGNTTDGLASRFRLRASGTDNTTASSYVTQQLQANGTTIAGNRYTDTFGYFGGIDDSQRGGVAAYVFGPALSQPTAFRSVTTDGFSDAHITDFAGTHNQSSSYDGFTVYTSAGSFTGSIIVYAFNQ